ncbi:MAG: cation diffusion facilitator family transporter [Gammaproteobacteria bacterium]
MKAMTVKTGLSTLNPGQIKLMRSASYASVALAFTLISLKIWAWTMTDSVAILSSLADSLLDLIASIITFYAVKVAVSPADAEHRFGHGKSEGVSSLLQAFIITASALYVAGAAVIRFLAPMPINEPGIGLGVMMMSLVLTMGLVGFQRFVVARTGSLAISADAMHYKADLLTNLAVLGAIFFSYRLEWDVLDPLLGLLIAGFIFLGVRRIVLDAIDVLLDRELPEEDRQRIESVVLSNPEVFGLHDMRTRSSGLAEFIQFHLELDPNITLTEAHRISDEVEDEVRRAFPKAEVIIHSDPYGLPERRDSF